MEQNKVEKRRCKISVRGCSGNVSKDTKQYSAWLPSKWIRAMNITPEDRDAEISFDGDAITIRKVGVGEEVLCMDGGVGRFPHFTVVDPKTGACPDMSTIAKTEEWAFGLSYCDAGSFAISESGDLIALDDCGGIAYPPEGRFNVAFSGCREDNAEIVVENKRMDLRECKKLSWPVNLWSAVLNRPVREEELPEDWEAALEKVLSLEERRPVYRSILLYFRDKLTLQEIANVYNVTQEYIRQVIGKTVRRLRHPNRRWVMCFGLEKAQLIQEATGSCWGNGEIIDESYPVDALDLGPKSLLLLKRNDILSIKDLTRKSKKDILKIRGLGKTCLREIQKCLADCGFSLRVEP